MQNGQLLSFPIAQVPEWPASSPPQCQNSFGMQDCSNMQNMQQHLLQTSPQRSPNHHNNSQQQMPYAGRSQQGMPQQQQQQQQQQPPYGMPLMNQHMQQPQGGPCGQQAPFMQAMPQMQQHQQEAPQCGALLATPGSQMPQGLQNLGRHSGPGMQSPFGGDSGMPVAPVGFQLLALPAGVAPPEGAIPAPAALQPQAPMQLNSPWGPAHQNYPQFPMFDTHTGQELHNDMPKAAPRFRIVNPETGKEVLPGGGSDTDGFHTQDNSSGFFLNHDQPRQWDSTHER